MPYLCQPLNYRRNALTAADTECGDAHRLVRRLQVIEQRCHDTRSTASLWMTKGNCPTVRVQLLHINAQFFNNSERLCSKGFIEFDDINIAQLHASSLQRLLHCRYWT